MNFDIPRTEWVPLSGRSFSGPKGLMGPLDRWVFHYRGVPGVGVPKDVLQAVANGHRAWMDDPKRGYALGYDEILISAEGHEFDGVMIEVRGTEFRQAATAGVNTIAWATCVWLVEDGKTRMSSKALARCRARSLELRTASPKITRDRLFGHGWPEAGSTTRTACPGGPVSLDITADGLLWADNDEEDDMPRFWRDERYHDVFQISPSVAPVPTVPHGAVVEVGRHHRTVRSCAIQCGFTHLSRNTNGGPGDWAMVPVSSLPDEPG